MNKEDLVISGFRKVHSKISFLNKFEMIEKLKGYKASEIHCIEYIGKNPDPNVTTLAEAFYMTNGAISKLTKKMIEKGVIESYQIPSNKKEIYFRLTKAGEEFFRIHEDAHQNFRERDKAVFEQVSEEELDGIINFTKRYIEHLDEEIKKRNIEINLK